MRNFAPRLFTPRQAVNDRPAPGRSQPGAGQADDFKRLVLPHLDGAYNLARYLTRDATHSEDIVQDAVLRAFRSFGQFRGGSARAWLFTIVRNCCRTAQASGAAAMTLVVSESSLDESGGARFPEQADPSPSPEEAMAAKDDVARVRAAIEAIPEPFRETVVLRDIEDLSYAEIAQVTGAPIGTVMSRLSRGRTMLANELLPAKQADGEPSRSAK